MHVVRSSSFLSLNLKKKKNRKQRNNSDSLKKKEKNIRFRNLGPPMEHQIFLKHDQNHDYNFP